MAQAINLTPVAFQKSNPKAQQNMAKAEKAADQMQEAIRRKAEFLGELVDVHFGGIDNLMAGLIHVANVEGSGEANRAARRDIHEEVGEAYRSLQKAHDDASQALIEAFSGR
jgi:hypothetical protein